MGDYKHHSHKTVESFRLAILRRNIAKGILSGSHMALALANLHDEMEFYNFVQKFLCL